MPDKDYKKADSGDIEIVIRILNEAYPVSAVLQEALYTNIVSLTLKKGATLTAEGEFCQYMYFIISGALMAQATYNGKKVTTYISVENEFVSSISGMHGMSPTKEGIIAVEPTSLVALPNKILLDLFEKCFDLNYAFRVLVQKYYQDAQERAHIIRVGNAKERYHYFLATKPGYIDRLPLEHIASLLDMKPQTLERIRKQHALTLKKDEETEQQCRQLEVCLTKYKLYSKKDISLSSLSRTLGITPHRLSFLINNNYHFNFVDFINMYRINSVREQLALQNNIQHFTIETLASNAGFVSRSAFYRAFKKQVGISPTEFVQSLQR